MFWLEGDYESIKNAFQFCVRVDPWPTLLFQPACPIKKDLKCKGLPPHTHRRTDLYRMGQDSGFPTPYDLFSTVVVKYGGEFGGNASVQSTVNNVHVEPWSF
ncbi:hypothetical protein DQ04_07421000 [Trypanosoma grayi]|uniref:hypothetical protein n=1 Tax=Trypanosoma grayi TaxID=71804 RepID=UPI0004F415A6|nr:hypothetical protein DQ04_07421000 [Trypanosoma grayi]KEG08338.1 hypothetical protein DQ04_07421000 [Trypanosoma grayi]